MKKLLAVLLLCSGTAMAEPVTLNRSSFTLTSETNYIAATYLDKIVIAKASAGGHLNVFNSTFTTALPISSVSLASIQELDFSNLQVKGIYYQLFANSAGVTIIYKK